MPPPAWMALRHCLFPSPMLGELGVGLVGK